MKSIIRKTFTTLLAFSFICSVSFAQAPQNIEPVKEKTNKIEIKTEKEIKDANLIKVSDDKVISNAKSHDCMQSKECKVGKSKSTTMNSKDCCKDKSTTMNSKDCCKDKSSAMNSKDCCKVKSIDKTEIKVEPETK